MTARLCAFCPRPLVRRLRRASKEACDHFEQRRFCGPSCFGAWQASVYPPRARLIQERTTDVFLEVDGVIRRMNRRAMRTWIRFGYLELVGDALSRTPAGDEYVQRRQGMERAA